MRIRLGFLLLLLLVCSPLPAAEPIPLRAGPVSMLFEPDYALLRQIRVGNYPVLQGINAPVRNRFWGTVSPVVTVVEREQTEETCRLTFDVSCREAGIDFSWRGVITGTAEGKVVFTFDGQANTTFMRNRIGFCVLHGPEAAGRRCIVETVDGVKTEGRFPQLISPHQPFKNLRAIAHQVDEEIWARVRMEGDTFEMEDQRNWTDASFKTYCTPLELPYPVRVEQGTKISHRIELTIEGTGGLPRLDESAPSEVVLELADVEPAELPGIGLRISSQVDELSARELQRLETLHLSHLRVDLTPAAADTAAVLRRATRQAKALGVPLQVGLHLGAKPEPNLRSLVEEVEALQPSITHWLVIAAGGEQLRLVRRLLHPVTGSASIGAGQDSNFTELNRERPDVSLIDAVSYGMNPQVHAFDNTSLVETLAIQPVTVASARDFVGQLPC